MWLNKFMAVLAARMIPNPWISQIYTNKMQNPHTIQIAQGEGNAQAKFTPDPPKRGQTWQLQ
jgi:hypothetical protein